MTPLSVLDLSVVTTGTKPAAALRNSIDLAQHIRRPPQSESQGEEGRPSRLLPQSVRHVPRRRREGRRRSHVQEPRLPGQDAGTLRLGKIGQEPVDLVPLM